MGKEELKLHLESQVKHFSSEMLHLTAMFIYNWTEGPWTPPDLSKEERRKPEKHSKKEKRDPTHGLSKEKVKIEI